MTQRKWTEVDSDLVARINSVQVTRQDLWRVARDSENQHGYDAGFYLVAKRFHRDRSKAKAVYFRMEALARLLSTEGAPGCTLPAAVEPLVRVGEEVGFERASFLNRVLAEAEVEGSGVTP